MFVAIMVLIAIAAIAGIIALDRGDYTMGALLIGSSTMSFMIGCVVYAFSG